MRLTLKGYQRAGFERMEVVLLGESNKEEAWWLDGYQVPPKIREELKLPELRKIPGEHFRSMFYDPTTLCDRTGPFYPTFYIHALGTRHGPGRYGHLCGWRYKFVVEELFKLRLPRLGDQLCPLEFPV